MILTHDEIATLKKIGDADSQLHECLATSPASVTGLEVLGFAYKFLINQDVYLGLTGSGKEIYLQHKGE